MLAWSGTVQPAIADQWNFSIQHELANNTTLQLGYVGQRTTHLMVPEWLKQGICIRMVRSRIPSSAGKNVNQDRGLTRSWPEPLRQCEEHGLGWQHEL